MGALMLDMLENRIPYMCRRGKLQATKKSPRKFRVNSASVIVSCRKHKGFILYCGKCFCCNGLYSFLFSGNKLKMLMGDISVPSFSFCFMTIQNLEIHVTKFSESYCLMRI